MLSGYYRNRCPDVAEIRIRSLAAISQEIHESIWSEFKELGYEDTMKPSEALTIIRFLFNGSKISNKGKL